MIEHTMKPKWTDHCNHMKHATSVYIGTFDVVHRYVEKTMPQHFVVTYDMYLYEASLGTEVCLRDGENEQDYCSIGTLDNLFQAKSEHYKQACELLMHKGVLSYELKPNKWDR